MSEQVKEQKKSQAEDLVDIVRDSGAYLFNCNDEAYVSYPVKSHFETNRLRKKNFRSWMARKYHKLRKKTPNSQSVQDTLQVLEGIALFEGPTIPVYHRIAPGKHSDEWYIDLGDSTRDAIYIQPGYWTIIPNPPIKFIRPAGLSPLPRPSTKGDISHLWQFVNIEGTSTDTSDLSDDRKLYLSFLLQCLRPNGPYPVLVLLGQHGSVKTGTARTSKFLVDPNEAPVQTMPRDEQSLMIYAMHSWLLSFDNASFLQGWLSDALCRMVTGGGALYRKLYTDNELSVFNAKRPVIINGITDVIHRPDLLQRSIILYLPRISDEDRKDEASLNAGFDRLSPLILGGLLDLLVESLKVPEFDIPCLPRMADFAKFACKLEVAAGWKKGSFLEAYNDNLGKANDTIIESNPIALAIIKLYSKTSFKGTATALLHELNQHVDDSDKRQKTWPDNAYKLGNAIRRAQPVLLKRGIDIEFERGKERLIRITPPSNVINDGNDVQPDLDDVYDVTDAEIHTHSNGEYDPDILPFQ